MHHLVLAYLDPASGSMLIQGAIAALVAGPVIFKSRVSRGVRALRNVASRRMSGSKAAEVTSPESGPSDTKRA